MRKAVIAVSALLAVIAVARAEEKPVPIKSAPGGETVEGTCGGCHSLDYIRTNAPFMTQQVWQAEVNKMINVFGAPVTPEEAKTIVDYLVKNYGKPG
jgi:hypothetical protein